MLFSVFRCCKKCRQFRIHWSLTLRYFVHLARWQCGLDVWLWVRVGLRDCIQLRIIITWSPGSIFFRTKFRRYAQELFDGRQSSLFIMILNSALAISKFRDARHRGLVNVVFDTISVWIQSIWKFSKQVVIAADASDWTLLLRSWEHLKILLKYF